MRRLPRFLAVFGVIVLGAAIAAIVLPSQLTPALQRLLEAKTGLAWHIGDARLNADLSLALADVTAAEFTRRDRPLLSIKTLTVDAPPKLLFGGGGTIDVRAQGVSAETPLRALAAPAAAEKLSELRLAARGTRMVLAADAKSAALAAQTVTARIVLGDEAVRSRKTLATIESDDGTVTIDATQALPGGRAAADADLTIAFAPRTAGPRITADARLGLADNEVRLDNIRGMLDGARFAGSGRIDFATKPDIAWDLRFDRIALVDDLGTGNAAPPPNVPPATPTIRTSVLERLDLAWLDRVQATGTTHVDTAAIGTATVAGVEAQTNLRDGTLDIAVASQGFYEGAARARDVLGRAADRRASHQLSLSIQKARALPFLADLVGVRGLDGALTVRADVQASGDRLDDAIKTAAGTGSVAIADGTINGLDLATTAGLDVGGLGRTAAGLIATRFARLTGTFRLQDGQAVTEDLHFDMPLLDTDGTGVVNLSEKTIDFRLHPKLAGTAGRPNRLDVPVRVAGPWGAPSVSTDFSGVLANPGAAIQGLQDLGGALTKGGAGGGLGGLGGLGGILDTLMPKGVPGRR